MHNPPDQGTRVFISPPRMPRIVLYACLLINGISRFVAWLGPGRVMHLPIREECWRSG
jgi:hypothetical protein